MSSPDSPADCLVKADLVLTNGRVWTVDKDNPQAEAVAVWNGTILAVGSTQEIGSLAGPATEIIDLEGKLVLPGFSDSHTHFVFGGFHLLGVNLRGARSEQEFGELLAAKSTELPEGDWLTGGRWDHENWPGGNYPTKELIDAYVPDRPVHVDRYDGHMTVANSLALQMAGISAETQNPVGGIILRQPETREPAGGLQDTASKLVDRIIPPPSRAQVHQAIEKALELARRHGFTCIHQVDLTPLHLEIYQELLAEGQLTSRIYGFIPIKSAASLVDLGIQRNFHHKHWIAIGGVKAFMGWLPWVHHRSLLRALCPGSLDSRHLSRGSPGAERAAHRSRQGWAATGRACHRRPGKS